MRYDLSFVLEPDGLFFFVCHTKKKQKKSPRVKKSG